MSRWPPVKVRNAATWLLLTIHWLMLACMVLVALLAGLLPVLVVCDNGDFLRCVGDGVLFFGIVVGGTLATVGVAIRALRRPSPQSRVLLLVYAFVLVCFRIIALPSMPNFAGLLDVIAGLGLLTAICVVFLGVGTSMEA